MKRLLALALALLALAGCSSGSQSESPNVQPIENQSATPTPSAPASTEPSPSVEAGIIEFTVGASFFDERITQEELDESSTANGIISATLNDDGSVTYTMTKDAHKEFMAELAQTIKDGLEELANSEDYATISKVEAEAPFVEFRVYLDANEVGLMESFTVLAFYMYGGMYNAFNGTEVDDISVYFINSTTGDVIQEAHSSDVA